MQPETIIHIEKNTVAKQQIEKLNGLASEVVLVPAGYTLENLEEYNETRDRFKGEFKTSAIEQFSKYVEKNGNAPCFVDANTMAATAIFDLGTEAEPGHCDHKAELKLIKTAPYIALLNAGQTNFTQREFAYWLMDWRENITCLDENEAALDIKKAITAVRDMKVEKKQELSKTDANLSQQSSAFASASVKGNTESMTAIIHFTCCPYNSLSQQVFVFHIAVNTKNLSFSLRQIGAEAMQEKIAEDFQQLLKEKLADESEIYIGSFTKR